MRNVFNVFNLIQPLTTHTLPLSNEKLKILKVKEDLFWKRQKKTFALIVMNRFLEF